MAGFAHSVEVKNTRGLDPAVYKCVVGFVRRDGERLTDEEVAAIQAAMAPETDATAAPAPRPSAAVDTDRDPVPVTAPTGTGGR